jgi:PAS domain S-box-containing protein
VTSIVWWDLLRCVAAVACLVVAGCAVATVVQPMLWHQRARILFSAVISFAIIHGQITNLGSAPMSGARTVALTVGLVGFAVGMAGLVREQRRGDVEVEPVRLVDRLGNIPAAVIVCDRDSRIITAAGTPQSILGWTAHALIGRPVSVIIPEQARAAHFQGLARFADTGQPTVAGQVLLLDALHRDDRHVPVSLVVVGLPGQRFLGVIQPR